MDIVHIVSDEVYPDGSPLADTTFIFESTSSIGVTKGIRLEVTTDAAGHFETDLVLGKYEVLRLDEDGVEVQVGYVDITSATPDTTLTLGSLLTDYSYCPDEEDENTGTNSDWKVCETCQI